MIHDVIVFFAGAVIVFGLILAVWAILSKFTKPEPEPEPRRASLDPEFEKALNLAAKMQSHRHEWRQVTPYVRQCGIRECSMVEFTDDVPDGMRGYVDLMTTRQARIDPNGEANHYFESDPRAWGPACPQCGRVIGFPWNLARSPFEHQFESENVGTCPYCQKRLGFYGDKKWVPLDELPKGE